MLQCVLNSFKIWLLVLIIVGKHSSIAQQYNFKNYSVENGLPYVQIFALYQDEKGYLWSGGYGGLSKFNGKVFQNFSPKNGLANHYVNAIVGNNQNHVMVGTIDGLSVITEKDIRNYTTKDGLPSNFINSLCTDRNNILWIGTNKGLCYFDGNTFKSYNQFNNTNISSLFYTSENELLVGTNKGLFQLNAEKASFTKLIGNTSINCISQCKITNHVFAGTPEGLYVYDSKQKSYHVFHVNNGLLDDDISAVHCSKNGETWIGSKNGLVSFNGKEFSYYNIGPDNNSNHIRSLFFDYENNLWIGTHNGLYKYRGKGFAVYDRQNGIGGAFIYQITKDHDKNLWFGTEYNGAYKFSDGFFKNYTVKDGLIDDKVYSILTREDGSVWFGTEKGISIFKNGIFKTLDKQITAEQEFPINGMYEDSKHNIWLAGKNGVSCLEFKNNKFTSRHYKLPAKAIDKNGYDAWSIIEDNDGNIWVGTYLVGLFKLENDQFVQQKISNPEVNTALDLCKDINGNLYAATLNGLIVFNPSQHSYKLISERDGLSSELVYAIAVTRDNKYIWAGTNQGINRIDLKKLQYNIIDIVKYGKTDGFSGVESNTHGIYEDVDSCIWFGTVNGLIKYSPKEFIPNDNLPKINLSNIKLAYNDTILASGSVLPNSLNNISFYFDGICLTNPDKVFYTYKLEGFDKEWSPATDINYTKYDNLPAGKYTFKVKCCNNEGMWTIEPATFSFTVKPPFYKTWWFILTCIISITGIVISVFKIRLYQIKQKQKAEFDQQVEISKSELKALRAQMNPHFVFNSLNSIQHYILNSKGDEAVMYLSKFAKLIRIILNNSEKPTVTINEDIEAVKLYLELEKMRFDNKFTYNITISTDIDGDYDEIPPMLIQPYLENAILHGINPKEGKGTIDINLTLIEQFIKITITDDGIGREASRALQHISAKSKHASLGMKITKDRLRLLNNMHQSNLSVNIIDLYNNEKQPLGTKVEIFIPYIK